MECPIYGHLAPLNVHWYCSHDLHTRSGADLRESCLTGLPDGIQQMFADRLERINKRNIWANPQLYVGKSAMVGCACS